MWFIHYIWIINFYTPTINLFSLNYNTGEISRFWVLCHPVQLFSDNYYSRGKLYFNKYKTSDTYGLTVVDVPKELNTVLKKWLKINPSAYVLISSNGNPLSSSQITRSLNRIFGKQVSVNMLRHIFLTNYYEDMPKLTTMYNIASKMGHNLTTSLEYAKKD